MCICSSWQRHKKFPLALQPLSTGWLSHTIEKYGEWFFRQRAQYGTLPSTEIMLRNLSPKKLIELFELFITYITALVFFGIFYLAFSHIILNVLFGEHHTLTVLYVIPGNIWCFKRGIQYVWSRRVPISPSHGCSPLRLSSQRRGTYFRSLYLCMYIRISTSYNERTRLSARTISRPITVHCWINITVVRQQPSIMHRGEEHCSSGMWRVL